MNSTQQQPRKNNKSSLSASSLGFSGLFCIQYNSVKRHSHPGDSTYISGGEEDLHQPHHDDASKQTSNNRGTKSAQPSSSSSSMFKINLFNGWSFDGKKQQQQNNNNKKSITNASDALSVSLSSKTYIESQLDFHHPQSQVQVQQQQQHQQEQVPAAEVSDEDLIIIDNVCSYYEKQLQLMTGEMATAATTPAAIEEAGKVFVGKCLPSISINKYLCRIVKYLNIWGNRKNINSLSSVETEDDKTRRGIQHLSVGARAIIASVCLYERMMEKSNGALRLSAENVHRIILACSMTSVKINEDRSLKNTTIANIGGVSLQESKDLETTLCSLLHFELLISEEHFRKNYILLAHRLKN